MTTTFTRLSPEYHAAMADYLLADASSTAILARGEMSKLGDLIPRPLHDHIEIALDSLRKVHAEVLDIIKPLITEEAEK